MSKSVRPGEGLARSEHRALPHGQRNSSFSHPPLHPMTRSSYPSHGAPAVSQPSHQDWTTWQELGIRISGLPRSATTRDLWRCFAGRGNIISIELYEDQRGNRDGKATVRFCPPPNDPFWRSEQYSIPIAAQGTVSVRISLEPRRRTFMHTSPADTKKIYAEVMVLKASSLDFGIMLSPSTMMNMCTVLPTAESEIQFKVNLLHREIVVEFALDIRDQRPNDHSNPKTTLQGKSDRQDRFRFRIPFFQLEQIHSVNSPNDDVVFLISLETPPRFFKKLDPGITHDDEGRHWAENDAWYRQTDVVYTQSVLRRSPLTLKKTRPIIDLGRWTTYRLVFQKAKNSGSTYNSICQVLQDYNIDIVPFGHMKIAQQLEPPVWELLDKPDTSSRSTSGDLIELSDPPELQLAFPVRYQLEVCISNGYLNEHNLDQFFIARLTNLDAGRAQDLLEYIANHGKRIYDPMSLFDLKVTEGAISRANIPHYCVFIRSATVTPTTVYFQTPVPETSNRVMRAYPQYADRFLRVRFTEEKSEV